MSNARGRVAVVGGGMSGIAAAYFLKRFRYEPEIIEAGAALGGRAGSAELGTRTIDIGGKNIGRRYELFRQFIADNGAPPLEFFGINSSTVRDGKLYTVDSQKKLRSLFDLLRLVGPRDFTRLLRLGALVRRHPEEGLLGGERFSNLAEAKDHLPLSDWFGERCVDSFLRPVTLRMNGAEPSEYSLGCLGSNLKMLFDRYDQLSHGMAPLLERFGKTVPTRLGTRVTGLLRRDGVVRGLELERAGVTERHEYDFVVLALPAGQAATLLSQDSVARRLRQVRYCPVTLIVARYLGPVFTPKVRAIVFDKQSALSNAGCYGVDDLDVVRYTLSGAQARSIGPASDPAQVLAIAERALGAHVSLPARLDFVYRHFSAGLCAYTPYHHRLLRELRGWEAETPNLALAGDYLYGASIEACFHSGRVAAERAVASCQLASVRAPAPAPSRPRTIGGSPVAAARDLLN